MIRFILHSFIFRKLLIIELVFTILFLVTNKVFDILWGSTSSTPLNNLIDVYYPPTSYDNFDRINIKLIGPDRICIEGNKKFRNLNKSIGYDYYDTIGINFPDKTFEFNNKIFIQFEKAMNPDSLYLVVSKSESKDIFWKQIFYSSVIISNLNRFSKNPDRFRINYANLVDTNLLRNNDKLIDLVTQYFNLNMNKFKVGDCNTNCNNFMNVCNRFALPCRILILQGGKANYLGYDNELGFPSHAVCEVYSSKYDKWFVIDPLFGLEFKNNGIPLNAIEICNKVYFGREKEIAQDSVLITKRSLIGLDYFRYYENIFYNSNMKASRFESVIYKLFYKKYSFSGYHSTNILLPKQDGYYYLGIKSTVYILLILLNIILISFIIAGRLFKFKKV